MPNWSLDFSPDDQLLALGGNGVVQLVDAGSGGVVHRMPEHTGKVFVAFSPDGKRLATAAQDGTVKLWDVTTGQHRLTLKGSPSGNECVDFSFDGQILAAGGRDGTIHLWRACTNAEFLKSLPMVREKYLDQ
jgi:WD40 repeat protein